MIVMTVLEAQALLQRALFTSDRPVASIHLCSPFAILCPLLHACPIIVLCISTSLALPIHRCFLVYCTYNLALS